MSTLGEIRDEFRKALTPFSDEREIESIIREVFYRVKGFSSSDIAMNRTEEVGKQEEEKFQDIIQALKKGVPIQYILGGTEFYGMDLLVDERVLIPRPETEEMVYRIVADHPFPPARILDVGTGSGCIALALKKAFPDAEVHASDSSQEALEVARENAKRNHLDVCFHQWDMGEDPPEKILKFDIVVSNPPYVLEEERDELSPKVRDHEPSKALFSPGEDPVRFFRDLTRIMKEWGKPGAELYVELHPEKANEVEELFKQEGLEKVQVLEDLSGRKRIGRAILKETV